MIGRRKRLLSYMRNKSEQRYTEIIAKLHPRLIERTMPEDRQSLPFEPKGSKKGGSKATAATQPSARRLFPDMSLTVWPGAWPCSPAYRPLQAWVCLSGAIS